MISTIKTVVAATACLMTPAFAALETAQAQETALVAEAEHSMQIAVNKGRLIRLERPATEVFIANPDVADVQVKSPRLVYIYGRGEGETSFYALDDKDQTIYSANIRVSRDLGQLRSTLRDVIPTARITAASTGGMILLQGSVASPEEAATAEYLAASLFSDSEVVNRISIIQPNQVNLRVRIAEVSRQITKEFGFNFETFSSGSGASIGLLQGRDVANLQQIEGLPNEIFNIFSSSPTGFAIAGALGNNGSDLNYAIDALDENGFITLLAEPNLTALSGESANFLAGGEFPIPIPSRDGLGIEFREFGVSLEFSPIVLDSGRISMRVRPEVSDLSSVGAITIAELQIPAIVTRRAETTVELGSGQSFAIAGLLQNELNQTARQLPFLGNIPILGALFRSDNFLRNETELLIVVTPYLVRPVSHRQLAMPTDNFVSPSDLSRILEGKVWQPRGAQPIETGDQQAGPSLKKRAGFRIR